MTIRRSAWALLLLVVFGFTGIAAAQSEKPQSERAGVGTRNLPTRCEWNAAERSPQDFGLKFNARHLELCRLENNTAAVRKLLRVIGIIHQNEGRPEDARKAYLEALGLSGTTAARLEMLDSLGSICLDHEALGNVLQVLQCREENLFTSELSGDRRMYARALRDFGDYHRAQFNSARAMDYYEREMSVYVGLEDKAGIGSTLRNIGHMFHIHRDISLAMEYFRSSIPVAEALGDQGELGDAIGSVCVLYRGSDYQKAIDCLLKEALPLYEAVNDKAEIAGIYINVARAYEGSKDFTRALDYYGRSIKLRDELDLYSKVAETYQYQAGLHYRNNDFAQALASYLKSIDALKKQPTTKANIRSLIRTQQIIATDKNMIPDSLRRLEYVQKNIQLAETYGETTLLAQALRSMAAYYSERREVEQVLKYSQRADQLESQNYLATAWRESWTAARTHRAKKEFEKAIPHYEEMLRQIESSAAQNFLSGLDYYFEMSFKRYSSEYIGLLIALHRTYPSRGFDSKALEVTERSKARSFLRSLIDSATEPATKVSPTLLERERKLRAELNAKVESLTRDATADSESLKRQIAHMREGLLTVAAEIRSARFHHRTPSSPPLTLNAIQNFVLDENTALIEYSLGAVWGFWVVAKESFKFYHLKPGRQLDADCRRLHQLLGDGKAWDETTATEYRELTSRLARQLIAPAYETLRGKRLLIVPDGALSYIPFGVLPVPSANPASASEPVSVLAEDHEIVSVPSVSVLATLRRQAGSRKPSAKEIALFADPVFEPDDERIVRKQPKLKKAAKNTGDAYSGSRTFVEGILSTRNDAGNLARIPRLPFSSREADAIFELAPRTLSTKAVGFDATLENAVNQKLSDYRVVHFATHAVLHSEYPELSGIVLSLYDREGSAIKGFLRLNEIYNMQLNADLVVLSACQTALGKEVRGEGLVGLTRGFMYAGSPRVVASLWKVDDVATAELMKIFYQKMLKEKMRPAAALRAAKIEMMKQKRWSSPYYWAAFELQGEWR